MTEQVEMVVHVVPGEAVEAEGVCEDCLHATLIELPMFMVSSQGVSELGTIQACYGCPDTEEDTGNEGGP